ncbi:hypothetical protein [Streptomyces sp. NBC_00989]|uniref:hypothetical protein n=1 Tax=Streptomyces sp. NBC_00989 TaxID=2903705 RepID=UPI003866A8F0
MIALLVVTVLSLPAQLGAPSDMPALNGLVKAVRSTPGVASVTAGRVTAATGLSVIDVVPTGAPQDESTSTLITHLREEIVPTAEQGERPDGLRRRHHGRLRRPRRPADGQTAAVPRGDRRTRLPVADGRLP